MTTGNAAMITLASLTLWYLLLRSVPAAVEAVVR